MTSHIKVVGYYLVTWKCKLNGKKFYYYVTIMLILKAFLIFIKVFILQKTISEKPKHFLFVVDDVINYE